MHIKKGSQEADEKPKNEETDAKSLSFIDKNLSKNDKYLSINDMRKRAKMENIGNFA